MVGFVNYYYFFIIKNKPMKRSNLKKARGGFTLIEILVVIGIIAVLAAIVIIAVNPARQFAQSRDAQRSSNLNAILNAVGQRIADNRGFFAGTFTGTDGLPKTCPALPTSPATAVFADASVLVDGTSVGLGCLVPTYISALPTDPTTALGVDTGYLIYATSSRIHVVADAVENDIPRTAPIEITR
jgi:type IV pilus assembly protein PilA